MKKILEVTDDVEKAIGQVCDFALKSAGLAAHEVVSAVKLAWAKVQQVEDKPTDAKPE